MIQMEIRWYDESIKVVATNELANYVFGKNIKTHSSFCKSLNWSKTF